MITKTEELMAIAFNDDEYYTWREMNNARKKILSLLEEGEKATKRLGELLIAPYGDITVISTKDGRKRLKKE